MDLYGRFYDGRLQTTHNQGLAIILLYQQMYQKLSATTATQLPFLPPLPESSVLKKIPTQNIIKLYMPL